MKKLLLILLALCLCLTVAACKSNDGGESKDSSVQSSSQDGSADTPVAEVSDETFDSEDDSYVYPSEEPIPLPEISYEEITTDSMEVYANNTYSVFLSKNDDGTYNVTALIPENIEGGKLVVSFSDKLSLVEGSLTSKLSGSFVNEKYKRDGVEGICVVFAAVSSYEKGAVALSANFTAETGAEISAKDISLPEWNLNSNSKYLATHRDTSASVKFISE